MRARLAHEPGLGGIAYLRWLRTLRQAQVELRAAQITGQALPGAPLGRVERSAAAR